MVSISAKILVSSVVVFLYVSTSANARGLTASTTDMASDIGQQVKDEVNASMKDMVEKCGPNASSIINDQCFGSCDGTLNIDGSKCTCNGSPCDTWAIGETGPKATSSDSSTAPVSTTAPVSSTAAMQLLLAIASSMVLLVAF